MSEEWLCVESCPIFQLDQQSGVSKSGGSKASANNSQKTNGKNGYEYGSGLNKSGPHHGGEGGASRYFATFPGKDDSLPVERAETSATVINGDCLEVLKGMESASVDAMVTDPPAGIGFMSASWDSNKGSRNNWIAWLTEVMEEALRVVKPGGHALVWALPRTSHWTAMALEDAGWEVRDRISHLFGSGFPKSANLEKMITKMQGKKRYAHGMVPKDGPESARIHAGLGSALKPSMEDWWLCRRPLSESSLARNVLKTGEWIDDGTTYKVGTGAIAIDKCRVNGAKPERPALADGKEGMFGLGSRSPVEPTGQGRFPANLLLSHHESCQRVGVRRVKGNGKDYSPSRNTTKFQGIYGTGSDANACNAPAKYGDPDGTEEVPEFLCAKDEEGQYICPVALLDEQSGVSKDGTAVRSNGKREQYHSQSLGAINPADGPDMGYGGKGGSSRFFQTFHEPDTGPGFFYTSKASKRDRTANGTVENRHPTTKPTQLMRYLCRLIAVPGGVVLDPFGGSGSTAVACIEEGLDCIIIEKEEEYVVTAEARIREALERTSKQHSTSLF